MPTSALIFLCVVGYFCATPGIRGAEETDPEAIDSDIRTDASSVAGHALVFEADSFRSKMDGRQHFVLLYRSRRADVLLLEETFEKLAEQFNTAESMKRIVLAKIFCAPDSELCRETLANEEAVLVLYGEDGSALSLYSGKIDYRSLYTFLEGLKNYNYHEADIQKIEVRIPQAKKVLEELTLDNFDSLTSTGHHFVKFYAPWCGHCQRLAPIWEELAKSFEYEEWITVGKVDCTEFGALCSKNNVRGYPTLIYFVDGKKIDVYDGARDHSTLKNYILKNHPGRSAPTGEQYTEDGIPIRDYVIPLTDETFLPRISEGRNFVMFFDPECVHCQTLEPDWESLALFFIRDGITFAKLDCSKYGDVCVNEAAYSLPALVFYSNGRRLEKYDGILNNNLLKHFVNTMKLMSADDGIFPDEVSFVVNLNQSNYHEYVDKGHCFINFFKPWCDFCKNLAPIWEDLARKFSNEREITIAKIDCSVSDWLCEEHGIEGYPSMLMFHEGIQKGFYTGSHDLESLYDYAASYLHHHEL